MFFQDFYVFPQEAFLHERCFLGNKRRTVKNKTILRGRKAFVRLLIFYSIISLVPPNNRNNKCRFGSLRSLLHIAHPRSNCTRTPRWIYSAFRCRRSKNSKTDTLKATKCTSDKKLPNIWLANKCPEQARVSAFNL